MANKTVKVAGEEVSLDVLNSKILENITSDSEHKKVASDLGSAYIRIINREEGSILRKVLPPETIGEKDLDQFVDTDRPGKIITIEPTGSPAVTLPFNSSAEIQYYFASKAIVPFFDIKTPRFQKNVYELMTYKDIDLRKVITENSLKDMQKEEDAGFIDNVDSFSTALSFTTGLTRDTWVEISKIMGKRMLRNGIALLNDATIRDFGKFDRTEFGGDMSEKIFKEGMSGLGDSKLFGMNLLSTLKADIVNDNVVYLFTEPDYLGKFYELKKPTLYVKRTEDILEVYASEKIGVCIANTAGVSKVTLAGYSATGNTSYPQPHTI